MKYFLLFTAAIIFIQCSNDNETGQRELPPEPRLECRDTILSDEHCGQKYLGFFDLLQSSKDHFPFDNDFKKYTYSDSLNNEIVFERTTRTPFIGNIESSFFNCANNNQSTQLCHEFWVYDFLFNSEDLDYELVFKFVSKVSYKENPDTIIAIKDVLEINRTDDLNFPQNQFEIVVDQRNFPVAPLSLPHNEVFYNELTILDKTFTEVFSDSLAYYLGSSPLNKYYFNYEFGMVGFIDENEKTWKLEKVE